MITIADTGPLVAYLNRNDPYHAWAVAVMKQVRPPLLTSEPVLTEMVYVLREDGLSIEIPVPSSVTLQSRRVQSGASPRQG